MLYQIFSLLLEVIAGLLGSACLLRLYMQHQRIPFGNPIGNLVFALSDWLVLPLRKVLRPVGRWDMASLVGAFLLKLAQYFLLWLMTGGALIVVPVMAVFGVIGLVIYGLTGLLIVYAILSWVQAQSPLYDVIARLVAPPLRPLRRMVPLVGGMDLTPLILLVLLQVASIVLQHALRGVLGSMML
ncbi:YggT family protein [Pseudorhodoferax sp.]|uniref:YggT family protein n=1 Tax=Pseudorhodoferax sp. TaxID=1993553 RepID=UPI002DD64C43|nr:YggT family protein [Pseudorhodoferax sp.]